MSDALIKKAWLKGPKPIKASKKLKALVNEKGSPEIKKFDVLESEISKMKTSMSILQNESLEDLFWEAFTEHDIDYSMDFFTDSFVNCDKHAVKLILNKDKNVSGSYMLKLDKVLCQLNARIPAIEGLGLGGKFTDVYIHVNGQTITLVDFKYNIIGQSK